MENFSGIKAFHAKVQRRGPLSILVIGTVSSFHCQEMRKKKRRVFFFPPPPPPVDWAVQLPSCPLLLESSVKLRNCDTEATSPECKEISGCEPHKDRKTAGTQSGSLGQLGTHWSITNRMWLLSSTSQPNFCHQRSQTSFVWAPGQLRTKTVLSTITGTSLSESSKDRKLALANGAQLDNNPFLIKEMEVSRGNPSVLRQSCVIHVSLCCCVICTLQCLRGFENKSSLTPGSSLMKVRTVSWLFSPS